MQAFIGRRFYQRKYAAARVRSAFGVAARDETGLQALTARLTGVVQATWESESVQVWLAPHAGEPPQTANAPSSST